MRPVWWSFRAGLRQDWRGLAVLTLITTLMGAVALTALAGARRTAPVTSPLTLLAIPAVLVLAYGIAAIPARPAARTQPALVLRTE